MAIYEVMLAHDTADTGDWLALNEEIGITMSHKCRDTLIKEALEVAPYLAVHNCSDGHPVLVFMKVSIDEMFAEELEAA
jgi:hypothetical protein